MAVALGDERIVVERVMFAMAKNSLKDLTCYGIKALLKSKHIRKNTALFIPMIFAPFDLFRRSQYSQCGCPVGPLWMLIYSGRDLDRFLSLGESNPYRYILPSRHWSRASSTCPPKEAYVFS